MGMQNFQTFLYRAFTCEHMHLSGQTPIIIKRMHNGEAIM